MVKIVTDSTCDLTPEIARELDISIIPLNVYFGSERYSDGVDLTTEEFYTMLENSETLPTTSSPSPGSFAKAYDSLAEETDEILSVHISSSLSATYDIALQGRELMKSHARVEIIDSRNSIGGLGLIAISAAKAARDGSTLDEIIEVTHSNIQRVDFRMAFDTLEYLRRGGRIGTASAFLGSMLKFNPIITIKDGSTEGVTRLRSRTRAIDYLYDFAASFPAVEEMAVEDANTPEETEMFVERLGRIFPRERIYRMKVSPVIGTNVGPRVLGVAVLPAK